MDKKELTKLLHKNYHLVAKKMFAENGFRRYKANDYARITEDDIVQLIDIQKHSWDTKFTYNITVFPLFFESDFMYYAFGGIRIGKFKEGSDFWWSYMTESEIHNSLCESLELLNTKVFPFFDSINNSKNLIEHLNSPDNLFEEYKLQPQNHRNEIGLLFLRQKDKENAYKYLDTQTINDIQTCGSEDSYLNNIILQNYETFGISKKK